VVLPDLDPRGLIPPTPPRRYTVVVSVPFPRTTATLSPAHTARRIAAVALAFGWLLVGCGTGDDDTSAADDDTTSGDDDSTPGDDDTTAGDDDDSTGDDDSTPGDDDDSTAGDDDSTAGDDDTTPAVGADLRSDGPLPVSTGSGSFTTSSGCTLDYDRYTPVGPAPGALVILAHGLECGREHLEDVGWHYASWGVDVAVPDLCHSTTLDLDQEQNGLDMTELADGLAPGPVIYAGHSAGGLAAFVATAHDPDAVALLGLDPTEWLGIGGGVAPSLAVPAFGMVGDPVVCNGFNNAVDLFGAAPQGRALRVTEADHCDFSSPNTCLACLLVCGGGSNNLFSDDQILDTTLGLSTAFLLWQLGLDATGEQWWTPGQPWYDDLLAAGAVSEL
jgi:pimeloyl-ACP methyl ester carboxylesterase